MKRYLLLALLLLFPLDVDAYDYSDVIQAYNAAGVTTCADTTCDGFLVCQNFEGTGYDNSESWTESVGGTGVVDEDDTTATVGRDSQQLKVIGDADNSSYSYKTFTVQDEAYIHFMVKFGDATPSTIARFWQDGGTNYALSLLTDGSIRFTHGSNYTDSASGQFSDNTYRHLWLHIIKSSGANDGVYQLWISDTTVKPGSMVINGSNGTRASGIGYTYAYSLRNYSAGVFVDQMLVKSTVIGDVCE